MFDAIRGAKCPVGDDEIELYRDAWRQPGARTAMVNWDRAFLKRRFEPIAPASIVTPVHIIGGRQDHTRFRRWPRRAGRCVSTRR